MTATLYDGSTLQEGDEVETRFHRSCLGVIFVVESITPYDACASGSMVIAHVKEDPNRKIVGSRGMGLDANWFKKIKQP